MCDVHDFRSGDKIASIMSLAKAEEIVGESLMTDELISLREECTDDKNIVEACNTILAVRRNR